MKGEMDTMEADSERVVLSTLNVEFKIQSAKRLRRKIDSLVTKTKLLSVCLYSHCQIDNKNDNNEMLSEHKQPSKNVS